MVQASDEKVKENGFAPLPEIQGANKDFYSQFGHFDDSESFLAKSELIMVRHAQSEENVFHTSGREPAEITDEVIYGKLHDCCLSELGKEQAAQLQPLANQLEFPGGIVYSSPLRRTLQTLCLMLDTHPQKSNLTVKVIPLAREVMSSYGNIPLKISELKVYAQQLVVEQHGFSAVDLSELGDDDLYFIKQLQLADAEAKQRFLSMFAEAPEGDHVKTFKQIVQQRFDAELPKADCFCIENNEDLYSRIVLLRQVLANIVKETEKKFGALRGRKKILVLTHGRATRAFASKGVNPEVPSRFLESFYSVNTSVTPFQLVEELQENGEQASTFIHNRPENYDF